MLQVIGTLRPPFLVLTPACLLLALAVAAKCCAPVSLLHFALALTGALAAHISVNAFNEYFDFRSGLDAQTQRTPFSGGSGTLVRNPGLASLTLMLALLSMGLVVLSGGYFIRLRGLGLLLPMGIIGLLLITLYTTWIVRRPLLCLLAAGSGFGLIMISGTVIALTGQLPAAALWAALPVFFVVNNLLLLNQLPDIDADRQVGRRTLPIVAGIRRSAEVYAGFSLLAALSIVSGILAQQIPTLCALGLLPLAASIAVTRGIFAHGACTAELTPYLAANVAISIATPLTLAIGFYWG